MFSRAFVTGCMLAVVCARLTTRSTMVHDRRAQPPAAFTNRGAAPPEKVLKLRIQLAQNDIAGLEKRLMDVSTPGNALYGQHLTKDEVDSYVAPKQETVDAVMSWLQENGIQAAQTSSAGDWLSFSVNVRQANELLNADFKVFSHSSGTEMIRTLSYSIPTDLQGHLELVHPTTSFAKAPTGPVFSTPPMMQSNLTSDAVSPLCGLFITPACLQALYGIPTTSSAQPSNVLAVSGFINEFASEADLKAFLTLLRPDLPSSTTFNLQTIDGGDNPQGIGQAGSEASLDIQYTVGVASNVPVSFISVGQENEDGIDGFLDIVDFLSGMSTPPTVLTTSYGFNEPEIPSDLASSLCNAYMQLGARGTSIIFSSGDGGVAGAQNQSCTTFIPTFPSSCPFITSVGATTGTTETAARFSSGGFSNTFPRPTYQSAAVTSYLNTLGSTNNGKFTTSGRGFPDVSAQGQNFEIVKNGLVDFVSGTSCSAPIFASIIALLNDQLKAAGRSSLGFLNPFLYSTGASAFNDVTTGSNPGCNTNGFPAGAGWDPVTGLGTPNFAKLRTAVGL